MVRISRVRHLNTQTKAGVGPVIYWMSRDHRVNHNWALLYAQDCAKEINTNVVVVFCLRESFSFATSRLIDFLIGGLKEVEEDLNALGIPFLFLLGEPAKKISEYVKDENAGMLVRDFNPLHYSQAWNVEILKKISIPFFEVDAHNIVPVWEASPKLEFGAYTLRPKIHKQLGLYLEDFPNPQEYKTQKPGEKIDWEKITKRIQVDPNVKPVTWCKPGTKQGMTLVRKFLTEKLSKYDEGRNDPNLDMQSDISPYLHFGHISAQQVALETERIHAPAKSKQAFLEELIVRRELSDNFCFYNAHYDTPQGFPEWAKKTHAEHKKDQREYLYTLEQFEKGETHDPLWNAAQAEMVISGKMHGYMRMYWAKKILEWTKNVEEAMRIAIYLNDRYELDGRDPNGYAGIAWSMGGVHDRAWFSRPVFGKIRYMNYNGAKSKFNVSRYIEKMNER